jgi:phenylalanyl-tRNA synthetase beta chain
MIVNTKWLKQYTEIPFSPEELEEKLTFLGLEATIIKKPADKIGDVIISEIKEITPHPNADRLRICHVSTGTDEMDVVCGAPNVKVGQKVPLAKVGTTLPGGITLKPVKIRGVESRGMLCAEDELGLSDNHEGIMVLDENAPVGTELRDYLSANGVSFDIDLTPNRPDCASHIGVARDITLLTGKDLRIPEIEFTESDEPVRNYVDVEIVNTTGCPRYAARVIRGVKVGPSPEWLVKFLTSVGLRSINNVVDAANFVLLETGHPLHTFDYRMIDGKKIVVRSAFDGEEVETLDGVRRELTKDVLLICDAKKPVAIAGIMGLANSEIKDDTTDILIESAYFDPATIRKGSKYLGLQTDASYRFERGADPEAVIFAIDRLSDLVVRLAGGSVCQGVIDRYPRKIVQPEITVRFKRVNSILGIAFEPNWVEEKFIRLGCVITNRDDESITIIAPSWRPDLEREIDMIEEIVRIYGMHIVPNAKSMGIHPDFEAAGDYELIEKLRTRIANYGLYEVYNNSLVNKEFTEFGIQNFVPVKVKNPLNQDMAYLRTTLIPGLLQTAKRNLNRQNTDLPLFEFGFVQHYNPESETHAQEFQKFAILLSGYIEDKYWGYERRKADLFILKGIIQDIATQFGAREVSYKSEQHPYFDRLIMADINETQLAYFGQVSQSYLFKKWGIENPVFVLEGDISNLLQNTKTDKQYKELPVFPGIQRDISILVDLKVKVADVEKLVRDKGGIYLREVKFYDLYQRKNIDKRKKSLTFNLMFQATDRTLQDAEVDDIMVTIHKILEDELGARLR